MKGNCTNFKLPILQIGAAKPRFFQTAKFGHGFLNRFNLSLDEDVHGVLLEVHFRREEWHEQRAGLVLPKKKSEGASRMQVAT
jgi:hypothetical protein